MMKKLSALLLIVALLALVGCASKQAPAEKVVEDQPSVDTSAPTQEVVEDVDAAFENLEDLESSLDLSDLESLDEELNFG